jgi:hypothetical protein
LNKIKFPKYWENQNCFGKFHQEEKKKNKK